MSLDKSQSKTLLIDADLYLYRAAVGAEEEIDWGDDIWSLSTDLKVAKESFENQLTMFESSWKPKRQSCASVTPRTSAKKLTRSTRATGRKQESRLATLNWSSGPRASTDTFRSRARG